ncbi:uncharacterized protein B0H64DRAFT_380261 [Chaetomium fimeti]|uniref:Uncharacterized protein n=1 Tax=Chaetomium fimeti TaxID=1854472 RepID=A0AAE0HPI4_9PEZI|nr:hypothetical protein B0H64DRAFT_380261 [Chaetomium fimeti]
MTACGVESWLWTCERYLVTMYLVSLVVVLVIKVWVGMARNPLPIWSSLCIHILLFWMSLNVTSRS